MEVVYLTMADLSKSSPAREHFVGLGNGLEKNCKVNAFFPIIGKKSNELSDVNFKASPLRFRLSFESRMSRLLALCLFNFFIPFIVIKELIFKKSNVVYSRHMPADLVNLVIAKLFNAKFCVEINGDVRADRRIENKNKILTKMLASLQAFVIKKSDYIVVPTSNLRRNIVDEYNVVESKVLYIENGVEISKFEKAPVDDSLASKLGNKFIFGYAGVFSEWQGIHLIVEAIKYLDKDLLSQSVFVLAGDGPEFKKIQALVKELDVEQYFYFPGYLQQEKYISVVKAFDVCLAPYIRERNDYWGVSPIKIHSYMACAKPIITSNISGARELITEAKCGYLFEPDNAESLAHYLTRVYSEKDNLQALGDNGFVSVNRNCTWDALAEKLYEKIK